MLTKKCARSAESFEVTETDLAFYDRISPVFAGNKYLIPAPSLSPDERFRRRLAFRNQIYLYTRRSTRSGKTIFSIYPEDAQFPVWDNNEWWEDSWDPLEYGAAFDPSRSFFEQFEALRNRVPHFSRPGVNLENSEYSANGSNLKNCYLVFATSGASDSMYGESIWYSKDCIDCTDTRNSELCYDCVACVGCYNVQSSQYSENCRDSYFLLNCRSCSDCFACANLRRKRFCVFNEQLSEAEYRTYVSGLPLTSFRERTRLAAEAKAFWLSHPRSHAVFRQVEGASGNFVSHSRNVYDSYFIDGAEDVRFGYLLYSGTRDCYDSTIPGIDAELIYESLMSGIHSRNLIGCYFCADGCSNIYYSHLCIGCSDCFGCVSLRKQRHCIFNQPYSPDEYQNKVAEIAGQMQARGEWGEFFPERMSSIPYNLSLAHRYFPLTKEDALALGVPWSETEPRPASHEGVPGDALADVFTGEEVPITVISTRSGRPFRITAEELRRYKQFGVPLPRLTYDERMELRAKELGGVQLYPRKCALSGKEVLSTFPPDSPWIIWDREEYERAF